MKGISTPAPPPEWLLVASDELRLVMDRWGYDSYKRFADVACVNYRTLRKLHPSRLDPTLRYATVFRIFSNLHHVRQVASTDPLRARAESQAIAEAVLRIVLTAFPPSDRAASLLLTGVASMGAGGLPLK